MYVRMIKEVLCRQYDELKYTKEVVSKICSRTPPWVKELIYYLNPMFIPEIIQIMAENTTDPQSPNYKDPLDSDRGKEINIINETAEQVGKQIDIIRDEKQYTYGVYLNRYSNRIALSSILLSIISILPSIISIIFGKDAL